MLGESFLLGACLYLLLRLRPWLGITPLVVTIGTLQFMQVVLAIGVYIEVFPGLYISPGSAVLFTGTILGVLLVYIVDDAQGARKLIYSLFLANVLLSFITLSVSVHMTGEDVRLFVDIPREIFLQHPRVMIVGTIALFLDTILVIVVYEFLARIPNLFVRIWIALSFVLIFDSVVFVTGSFIENKDYIHILVSSIIGKLLMVPTAAFAVALLDGIMKKPTENDSFSMIEDESCSIGDFFNLLTYRQKYELAKKDSMKDSLTGLHNRRALEMDIVEWNDLQSYSVLIIDADKFKSINDEFGHSTGDIVLRQISTVINSVLRGSDVAYRYGGEEFVVFLPNISTKDAVIIGERIRDSIELSFIQHPLPDNRAITVTMGVAAAPQDGKNGKEIIVCADQRLYQGKNQGRDRVVWA